MTNDYRIQCSPIGTKNPQVNKKGAPKIGNIICIFTIQEMDLDHESHWEGILSSIMFAIRSKMHNTIQHIPSQLIFDRDAILNFYHEANWQLIKQRKQASINKGNHIENHS